MNIILSFTSMYHMEIQPDGVLMTNIQVTGSAYLVRTVLTMVQGWNILLKGM